MSASNYNELVHHIGHELECVQYGDDNVAIECLNCNEILLDYTDGEEDEDHNET